MAHVCHGCRGSEALHECWDVSDSRSLEVAPLKSAWNSSDLWRTAAAGGRNIGAAKSAARLGSGHEARRAGKIRQRTGECEIRGLRKALAGRARSIACRPTVSLDRRALRLGAVMQMTDLVEQRSLLDEHQQER